MAAFAFEQFLGRPFAKSLGPKAEFINPVSGGFGPINFCKEFGLAAFAFEQFPGRPFAKSLGPKAEFINSVSGGFGPISVLRVYKLCPTGFGPISDRFLGEWLGRGPTKSGAFGADKHLQRSRLVGYRIVFTPWPALCENGWGEGRVYKFGVWRLWAHKLLQGIRLGGFRL